MKIAKYNRLRKLKKKIIGKSRIVAKNSPRGNYLYRLIIDKVKIKIEEDKLGLDDLFFKVRDAIDLLDNTYLLDQKRGASVRSNSSITVPNQPKKK